MTIDSELEPFIKSFQNEADLREKLAVLFSKMRGIHGVQITHGQQEYGKDLVFYAKDALDDSILYACVVKKDKLSGAADGQGSARNVLNQVEEALDTPHLNPASQEEDVAYVYVISPYDCPQTTLRSIKGKLKSRAGQVKFLCGRLLLEKFAKHWPDYLSFETTLIGSYLARSQRTFDETDPVAFLLSQHQVGSKGSTTLANVYVRQRFKKVLQEAELLASVPDDTRLRGAIREDEMQNFVKSLFALANLLRHQQAWDISKSNLAEPTASELRNFAELIRTTWDVEYDKSRSEQIRLRKKPVPRFSAQVNIRVDFKSLQSLLARARGALEALGTRIKKGNLFVEECADIMAELGSAGHLAYCDTSQIVSLSPTAFRSKEQPEEHFLSEDLLNQTNESLLVTAPAGYGKTSFCKWNFLNDVKMLIDKKGDLTPVYVPLHQLATISVTTIDQVFVRTPEVKQLIQSAVSGKRRIRFYLDGLDEVSTTEQQRQLMELASQLPTAFLNTQVVVTGRDYVSGHWLRWLPRVNLAELTKEQVSRFVKNWLGDDPKGLEKFTQEIGKSRTLPPLMHVPLLATLIIAVFKRTQSLPDNKLKLYEIFVDLMCGGWDIAKNVRRATKYGTHEKLSILVRLAGQFHIDERRSVDETELTDLIRSFFPSLQDEGRAVLGELLEDGLLVNMSGGIGFAHLSFQEYLAAKDLITDPNGERQKLVLRRFLRGEEWWREVLAFYVSMSQRPDEVAEWVTKVALGLSRDLRSQDILERRAFLTQRLQEITPGWVPAELPRSLKL
jgi:hypothetical protein